MIAAILGAGGIMAALSTGAVLHRLSRPVRTGQTGELKLERVAADIYLWRGYFSNAAAFVLPGQILVIDTLVSPELAMRMRRDLARAVDKPIGRVVLTHSHGDHVGGTSAFADVPLIGSARTATCMIDRDGDREAYAHTFGLLTHGVPPVLQPTQTFAGDKLTLTLDGERIEVLHLGAAETEDACVVWWPARRVLACGDSLATVGYPFTGAPIGDEGLQDDGRWLACLRRIRDLEPDVLLPGHGPALVGREVIRARIDRISGLFAEVLQVVRQEKAAGGAVAAVVQRALARLDGYDRQPDLQQNAISQRMAVLRAFHAVSPERRGRGWWQDLGPRSLAPADPAAARIALATCPAVQDVLSLGARLAKAGHADQARDLMWAAAARDTDTKARYLGHCAWWLIGAARRVASAYEGSDALVAAGAAAQAALVIDANEPNANLALGVLEIISAMMLGQPMQRGMALLNRALPNRALAPSGELTAAQVAAAHFFLGKAHQFEERDGEADDALRLAMPGWSRLLFPLFRRKLRSIP